MQAGCTTPVLDFFGLLMLLLQRCTAWGICVSQHRPAALLQLSWSSVFISFVLEGSLTSLGDPSCLGDLRMAAQAGTVWLCQ